jgi:hypothetical protein
VSIGCVQKYFPARGRPVFCFADAGMAKKKSADRNRVDILFDPVSSHFGSPPDQNV